MRLKNPICLLIGGKRNLRALFNDQSKGEKAKKKTKKKRERITRTIAPLDYPKKKETLWKITRNSHKN